MTEIEQQQADLEGMLQAERKYSEGGQMTGMEVYELYQVVKSRPLSVTPYVAPKQENFPDNGELTPSQKRTIKMTAFMAPILSTSFGLGYVVMSGALNSVLAYCIGGGFAISLLSGLFSGSSSGSSRGQNKGHSEYHYHEHKYYQQNNFGSNAQEQKNA